MTDRTLTEAGKILMACSVFGIGVAHFILPGLRPLLAPISPDEVWSGVGPIVGVTLIIASFLLIVKKTRLVTSLFLAAVFLFSFVFGHLPNRIQYNPEVLAYWTDTLKLLSMIGGMMMIAQSSKAWSEPLVKWLSKGKYLFAVMLVIFGIDHFLYVDFVSTLVPSFIPAPRVWTYATGVALFAAGVSIFTNVLFKLATRALALMLTSWLLMIHIPYRE